MGVTEEKIIHYRDIRKNTILWGGIYTSLALLLTLIAGVSSDAKTNEAGLILTFSIAGIALLILAFITIRLRKLPSEEKVEQSSLA